MMEHYVVIILVATGTYLARFLPMYFNEKFKKLNIDEVLAYSSTALISALFITLLVSFPIRLKNVSVSTAALSLVFVSYKKWKNLGFSVLIGVITHLLLYNI